mmetsp:Transcript_50198/g.95896  ORF Transcript_50198/g.95896 Transcript_50198/m.95896 type:complete len:209 (-) Transcript_50198:1464-2090(-)
MFPARLLLMGGRLIGLDPGGNLFMSLPPPTTTLPDDEHSPCVASLGRRRADPPLVARTVEPKTTPFLASIPGPPASSRSRVLVGNGGFTLPLNLRETEVELCTEQCGSVLFEDEPPDSRGAADTTDEDPPQNARLCTPTGWLRASGCMESLEDKDCMLLVRITEAIFNCFSATPSIRASSIDRSEGVVARATPALSGVSKLCGWTRPT